LQSETAPSDRSKNFTDQEKKILKLKFCKRGASSPSGAMVLCLQPRSRRLHVTSASPQDYPSPAMNQALRSRQRHRIWRTWKCAGVIHSIASCTTNATLAQYSVTCIMHASGRQIYQGRRF